MQIALLEAPALKFSALELKGVAWISHKKSNRPVAIRRKTNQLSRLVPEGLVADSGWLPNNGY